MATVRDESRSDGATAGSTSARTVVLVTEPAERVPGQETRGMAVIPGELDRVGADVLHPHQFQVRAKRRRVEHPFARPFVATGGAGAFTADQLIRQTVNAMIRPGHLEDLVALERTDVRGRLVHGHGS